ncbi:T9SS type A sorting domain-containing protein [Candidatus Eisenbacteria bacterium]|uniref:T9SS type A sorting domain-containing protein n=1 Tax=Eiseniibacteriota bacterium TaxID=2212470 RepID=A0ABV6YN25_UNCEI
MLRESRIAYLSWFMILLLVGSLYGQGPDSLWHRAFGDTLNDWGFSVIETHDGYFVTAGQMQVYNPDSGMIFLDVYVLKLDAAGDTIWARTYGGDRVDGSRSVIEASDGNYVVTGYTDSWGSGDNDIYVLKIGPDGDLIWERVIGGSRGDEVSYCVREAPDSTYRIVGTTDAFGDSDVFLVGIAADGSWYWEYPYDIPGHQSAHELAYTPDGYLVMVGSYFGPTVDVFVMKTEGNGDTLWTRTYDFGPLDYGTSVQPLTYDTYLVAGYSQAALAPFYNAFLLHIESNGDVNWTKFYGGPAHDTASSVKTLADGGFVFTGGTRSYGAGGDDVWLVRTDADGDTVWTKTYGGVNYDSGREVQVTSDNGFIIGGHTVSFGNGIYDLYLVKAGGDLSGVVHTETPGVDLSVSVMPNPSSSGISITFEAPVPHQADLVVCDLLGRRVKRFTPIESSAGAPRVEWDGCDEQGRRVSPGIYFLQLRAGGALATQKIIVLR